MPKHAMCAHSTQRLASSNECLPALANILQQELVTSNSAAQQHFCIVLFAVIGNTPHCASSLTRRYFAAAHSADAILMHLQQSQRQAVCFVAFTPACVRSLTQTSCLELNPYALWAMICCRPTSMSAKLLGRTAKALRQGSSG